MIPNRAKRLIFLCISVHRCKMSWQIALFIYMWFWIAYPYFIWREIFFPHLCPLSEGDRRSKMDMWNSSEMYLTWGILDQYWGRYVDYGHIIIRVRDIKSAIVSKTDFTNDVHFLEITNNFKSFPPIIEKLSKIWHKYRKSLTPPKLTLVIFTEISKVHSS